MCTAARPGPHSGFNDGVDGGRICWAVAGTLCEGKVDGLNASKHLSCGQCDVFKTVQKEEGEKFHLAVRKDENHALYDQFLAITSIVNSMNALVYVSDLETHELLFVNPYGEAMFGSEWAGRRCFEVLQAGQTRACAFCTNNRLLVDGQPGPPVVWEFQNTITRRWFQCIDRAIRWWDGRLVRMEVAFDISDRKEIDRFREQYVGLVSHDLRNPLNGILLNAQVLKQSARKRNMGDECSGIDHIIGSATRMDALIEDLLETTRLESGRVQLHREMVDLDTWMGEVVHRAIAPAERARVAVHRSEHEVRVSADRNRLERVVENLLSNAFKYSGDASVDVRVRKQGAEGVVSVIDHGKGIAPAELPHVFDRFYRGAHVGPDKGLGLGLYNARLIVEAHAGRIWVESPENHGAAFHFALPLA